MKFFKHFSDAHRGKSVRRIKRELGMAGIGMYWTLVELCSEKLEKLKEEVYTEAHCVFEFDIDLVVQELGTKRVRVGQLLATFQEAELLAAECTDNLITISMPKLLECLDRDAKRARSDSAPAAPKRKSKIKIKRESICAHEFERLAEKYKNLFPGTTTGKSEDRFNDQITSFEILSDFEKSMDHYRSCLNIQTWREPKTTLATYLGTESSGFFWREYITMPEVKAKPKPGDFKRKESSWSELAKELWRCIDGGFRPNDIELFALAEKIGVEKLKALHRDDFRPHGIVPGLLKDASERMGAA